MQYARHPVADIMNGTLAIVNVLDFEEIIKTDYKIWVIGFDRNGANKNLEKKWPILYRSV